MKATILSHGVNLGKNLVYEPGDQVDWKPKNIQPLIDAGAAVASHIDITPRAAELAKAHGIDITEVNGSGSGDRIVVGDVRALLESDDESEETE